MQLTQRACQWPKCDSADILSRGLCQRDYKRAKRAGILHQFTAPERTCGHCGNSFATGKNGKHSYCSMACQRAAVRKRREDTRIASRRPCVECGQLIGHNQRSDAMYCSTECQQAVWYRANDEALKVRAAEWKKSNRDKAKNSDHKRRAAIRGNTTGPIDYQAAWDRDNGCCWICGLPVDRSIEYPHPQYRSWDHVVPIIKGGAHSMDNIALSHLVCNTSKRSKILDRRPTWAS